MFSLESLHPGDSNEYTQYTFIQYEKEKHHKIIPNLQLWDFFQGTPERVRNSRGKRAISVRAIEVLLYYFPSLVFEKAGYKGSEECFNPCVAMFLLYYVFDDHTYSII